MTDDEIQTLLGKGGNFALPYLIKFRGGGRTIRLVNNNENVVLNGEIYHAGAFKYTLPKTTNGVLKGGSLEVATTENALTEFIEFADASMSVEVTGVIAQNGSITPIRRFTHQYGTATIDGERKLSFSFTNDDRMDMTFPPYVFDSGNNRGNA